MLSIKNAISIINNMSKNKINKININISNDIIKLLNILVDYNIVEYTFINKHTVCLKLKYKNYEPILKSLKYIRGSSRKNINYNYAKKEFDNKKAIYILTTNMGLVTLEKAIYNNTGGIILYKIII